MEYRDNVFYDPKTNQGSVWKPGTQPKEFLSEQEFMERDAPVSERRTKRRKR